MICTVKTFLWWNIMFNERIMIQVLKEAHNSCFCVTPKISRLMSLHYISQWTQIIRTTDTVLWLELITVILSCPRIFSFKETFTYNFQYFRKFAIKSKAKSCIFEELSVPFNFVSFLQLMLIRNYLQYIYVIFA